MRSWLVFVWLVLTFLPWAFLGVMSVNLIGCAFGTEALSEGAQSIGLPGAPPALLEQAERVDDAIGEWLSILVAAVFGGVAEAGRRKAVERVERKWINGSDRSGAAGAAEGRVGGDSASQRGPDSL